MRTRTWLEGTLMGLGLHGVLPWNLRWLDGWMKLHSGAFGLVGEHTHAHTCIDRGI